MSFWLAVVVIVFLVTGGEVISRGLEALSRRREASSGAGQEELRELREQVEVLARRVDRLAEEQRFLTRLLEERPRLPDHSKSGEAV